MRRNTSNATQELTLQTLNTSVKALRALTRPLTDNESKFLRKMEQVNALVSKGCESFTLCFKLSEAHWLYSSIKYDECFELYSSMHKGFMQLLEKTTTPVTSRAHVAAGLKSLLT